MAEARGSQPRFQEIEQCPDARQRLATGQDQRSYWLRIVVVTILQQRYQ
jgi:hypothetical protein